jgi:multidrug efflux pump
MVLSRLAIERPVFATVISLLLVVFGMGALLLLPVREYPDVDPPIVSVFAVYPGASATVVDRDITETIEDAISGIEGINTLTSTSRDEVSQVSIEFILDRDLEAAAADVRDKIGQVRAELPEEAEDLVISKTVGEADPIMWLTLTSDRRDRLQLTDYADRNLVDPLSGRAGRGARHYWRPGFAAGDVHRVVRFRLFSQHHYVIGAGAGDWPGGG